MLHSLSMDVFGKWFNIMIKTIFKDFLLVCHGIVELIIHWGGGEWWKPLVVGSFSSDPPSRPPPGVHTRYNPLLSLWAGPSDPNVMKRTQQERWDGTATIRLTKTDFHLAGNHQLSLALFCLLSLQAWMKQAIMLERPTWQGTEGGLYLTTSVELGPSVQQPVWNWILPTTSEWTWRHIRPQLNLGMLPVTQDDTLTAASGETLKERYQLRLCLQFWSTETVR